MGQLSNLTVSILGDSRNVIEEFGRVRRKTSDLERGFRKLGRDMKQVGDSLTRSVTLPMAAIGASIGAATMKAADFSRQMSEVRTLLPNITDEAFSQMNQDVLEFSQNLGVLPEEVVPALYQSISAGVPRENVFTFLETAQRAAVGGATDLQTAVDGISSAVNAFGEEALSAEEASDLMFSAVRLGKTTFEEMSASLSDVAPVASSLNVEFENITAGLAAITAQGVPTNQATRQLRQLMLELSREGTRASEVFSQMAGTSFQEFMASGGDLAEAMELISRYAEESGTNLNDLFGNVQAGTAALALTGENSERLADALEEMGNSAGAADDAFETMEESVSRQMERIGARINAVVIELGSAFLPVLENDILPLVENSLLPAFQNLADRLSDMVQGFQELSPAMQTTIVATGGFVAAAGPALSILGRMTTGIIGLKTALGGLKVGLGALTVAGGPLTLLVAGLGAAGLGIRNLARTARENRLEEQYSELGDRFDYIAEKTGDIEESILVFAERTGLSVGQVIELAESQGLISEEMREQLQILQEKHALEEGEQESVEETLRLNEEIRESLHRQILHGTDVREAVLQQADAHGVSLSRVLELTNGMERLTEEQEEQIEAVREENEIATQLAKTRSGYVPDIVRVTEEKTDQKKLGDAVLENEQEISSETEKQLSHRERANKAFREYWAQVNAEWESLGDTLPRIEGQIDEVLKFDDEENREQGLRYLQQQLELTTSMRIQRGAFTTTDAQRLALLERINEELETEEKTTEINLHQLEQMRDRLDEIAEEQAQRVRQFEQDWAGRVQQQEMGSIEQLEAERDEQIRIAEEKGAEVRDIELYYEREIAQEKQRLIEETNRRRIDSFQNAADQVQQFVSQISAMYNQYSQNVMRSIDNQEQRELNALKGKEDRESERIENQIEKLEEELAETQDIQERKALHEEITELEKEQKIAETKEKFEEKRREAERRQAMMTRNIAIFESIVNTASAVASALPNLILAALVGSMGAAQTALIASQPLPELAEGGVAGKEQPVIVGDGPEQEGIIPLNDEVLGKIGQAQAEASGNNSNGQDITIKNHLYIDGKEFLEFISRATYDGKLKLAKRSLA